MPVGVDQQAELPLLRARRTRRRSAAARRRAPASAGSPSAPPRPCPRSSPAASSIGPESGMPATRGVGHGRRQLQVAEAVDPGDLRAQARPPVVQAALLDHATDQADQRRRIDRIAELLQRARRRTRRPLPARTGRGRRRSSPGRAAAPDGPAPPRWRRALRPPPRRPPPAARCPGRRRTARRRRGAPPAGRCRAATCRRRGRRRRARRRGRGAAPPARACGSRRARRRAGCDASGR